VDDDSVDDSSDRFADSENRSRENVY